jgi:DNA-binding NarL/FixJ family response regulator
MPDLNGLEATRQIRREMPKTEVLIFTMHETEHLIREVLSAGARGYVLKSDAGRHLISAVEALSHHKPFFTAKVSEALLDAFLKSAAKPDEESVFRTLTDRERKLYKCSLRARVTRRSPTSFQLVSRQLRPTEPP